MKIYGSWELYDISGGMSGDGYNLNFEYLEIKEYGVYGFINNSTLLEYGKISLEHESVNEISLIDNFGKDRKKASPIFPFFIRQTKKLIINIL